MRRERVSPRAAQPAKKRRRTHSPILGFSMTIPTVVVVGIFLAYPIVSTFVLSFYEWDGIAPFREFIGLDNYTFMFEDDRFHRAFRNTILWGVITVPLQIGIAFVLAICLTQRIAFQAVARSVFILPAVLSSVVIAALWRWVYNPEIGTLNTVLGAISDDLQQVWLGDPNLALPAAMVTSVWRWVGLNMIFYLAALQSIDPAVIEAARVDGASPLQIAGRIIAPLVMPMTALLALLGAIGTFREFETIYILTGGGPAGTSEIVSLQIFNYGFQVGRAGYGATLSVVLLMVSVATALIFMAFLRRANRANG